MDLISGAVQLAKLASNAGKVIDGYNEVQKRLSASEDIETQLAVADYDTVVILAKPAHAQAYRDFFNDKKMSLKNMVSSGYNECAFDVAVKMGAQVSKEQFDKVQEKTSFWHKTKIRFADWFQGKNAYITDCLNPRMLKNVLTFNYENLESDNLKLIAKVLESLYHEYVSYYEWLAMNEDAKKVTQEDDEKLYAGCYYSEQKKLWIIHDENLWKTAVIVTHLVKILTCPNVQCHNDKMLVSGSFGIASIVPIALYHMHFLNEFLQKEYRRPEHDKEIADKRQQLADNAKTVVEKLSKTTSKGALVKKMADYASGSHDSVLTDTEVANLLNIKALQLISESLQASQKSSKSGVLGSFKESDAVVSFQEQFDLESQDLVEAQKAHAESVKAIHDLQTSAQKCDVFVDSASLGNLFGILKNKRQTVISSYFKLHDFQGHLRVFQDYVVAVESFAQKALPGVQVSLMLADKSLEYVVKNLPFQLSTIIFPSYPVIDNGIFITTCKEKYFQQMTSSSFEFLMVEEDKLTTADVNKLDQVTDALKKVEVEYTAQKDTLTLSHNQGAQIPQVKALVIKYQLEQKDEIKGKKTLNELLACFAPKSQDKFAQFIQARHEALEGLKGFLKEIEAAFLTKEKVISVDASQDYREACYGQMTAFINEFVFGINQSHIKQVSELTMQMFSASYPEQMPFLQHMFRTRMGLLNEFAKFSSYDMVVHWQLAHSMLYFSTQELYGKGAIERGKIDQKELKEKLFTYFQGKTPKVDEVNLFLEQKLELIEQIASLRVGDTDFRFLISLCVATLMVEYDHLVQLYLVQQALRQLVGLYGEEFIRTNSFQQIIVNFTKVLSEVYENFEDSSRALTKSIDAWKESLQKDATRVKVHGNSYQAVRKIAKLRERLDVYKELVTKTNDQVKAIEGAQEWAKAKGYTGFCQAFVDDSKAQIYAPQLEENLDTFYDANVIKAASTLKDKRYTDFQDSMHTYLEQGAKILKDLRLDNQKPKLVSMIIEDQLTEIALGQKLANKPCQFTAVAQDVAAAQDTPSQIISGFNSESKAYIYMQLVLSSSSSTLKNDVNIRQLVSFVINTEDMVNLYGLFSQLNELMLKMYAHGIGDEPIYQGDSKDKVLSARMKAALGEGAAQSRYAQLCNIDARISLSEFIAKYLDLISVSKFKTEEKRLLNDDSVSFYTVAVEIMHALLQAYVKIAINIEYATRSRNFSGSEQNQLRLWAVDVMSKLQIKRFDENDDVRYQGFSPVYKVDDLKVSLLLKAMLANTNEHQKEVVGSLSTQRTTIQLVVQEELRKAQSSYLQQIVNLTGSECRGSRSLNCQALITRKTTRSGQRKTPVYMNILTSMESDQNLRALSKYTFKSSYHVLDKQTFTQDSIVEIEKYKLLKGVMLDPKSQREIAFQSFGGFNQNVMSYLMQTDINGERDQVKKDTWLAVRAVFDGGKKQALLAQAYLILDEPAKLQSLIDAYQTSGQFDLVLLDGSVVTSVEDAEKKDPNSHEFYPVRKFKQKENV